MMMSILQGMRLIPILMLVTIMTGMRLIPRLMMVIIITVMGMSLKMMTIVKIEQFFGCALTKNCSIDIKEMNLDENVGFVSHFMRIHSKEMSGLCPLHQELSDYYFVNDSKMDSREVLVWLHPNFMIHMDDMIKLLELIFKQYNASEVNELQSCWYDWLTIHNHEFNLDHLELIFIPIFSSNHYFLFVVNIPKKMQFVENLSYDKQERGAISQLCDVLAGQVSTFFDGMGVVDAPYYIIDYPIEFVTPIKRVLRAKICAALMLSDRNDVRSEILEKMKAIRPSRP
ncbi:Metalloproteinase inhibitor 3 [Bienertia sinuspersici]